MEQRTMYYRVYVGPALTPDDVVDVYNNMLWLDFNNRDEAFAFAEEMIDKRGLSAIVWITQEIKEDE